MIVRYSPPLLDHKPQTAVGLSEHEYDEWYLTESAPVQHCKVSRF